MQIGKLNKRITLQKPTQTSDLMGGLTTTWSDYATVWAALWPSVAKETDEQKALVMRTVHRIRIRYLASVVPSWRVRYGSRYFSIVSILNQEERNEWLDLMCEETT